MGKVFGWLLLLLGGGLGLPLVASFLDGQGTENWILPVVLGGMALLGALVGVAVPGFLLGTTRRQVAVGALCGLGAAVFGVLVFFLLLNGLDGA